jgi:hypothetical protein
LFGTPLIVISPVQRLTMAVFLRRYDGAAITFHGAVAAGMVASHATVTIAEQALPALLTVHDT